MALSLSLSGSMALCDSHSGSQWLSLPLSGILWPSLAHYCSLISRIQPLIGSQGPCSALITDATMTHFIPLWSYIRLVDRGQLMSPSIFLLLLVRHHFFPSHTNFLLLIHRPFNSENRAKAQKQENMSKIPRVSKLEFREGGGGGN